MGFSNASNPLAAVPKQPQTVIQGDFDNDGDIDVFAYPVAGSLLYFQNNGSGVFSPVPYASSPFSGVTEANQFSNSEWTYVADFDNDGDQDIWDYYGGGTPVYLRNNGGSYVRLTGADNPLHNVPTKSDTAIQGDFDGDGDIDVFSFPVADSLLYFQNNGSGVFSTVPYASSPFRNIAQADQFQKSRDTHVADFDGDGDMDVWDASAKVYLQNDNGIYARLSGAASPLDQVAVTGSLSYSIVGDFDTDGDIDVLGYNTAGNTPEYFQNDGSGHFTKLALAGSPFAGIGKPFWSSPYSTYVADFDHDGDVDVWDFVGDSGVAIYDQQLGSPPKLSASTPLDNATGVAPGADLILQFNEPVSVGSGSIRIYRTSGDALIETIVANGASVTGSGTASITINPTTPLADLTGYYLLIDTQAFRDADGMVFAGISDKTKLNFTTGTSNTVPTATNLTQTVPYTEDPGASVPLDNIVITDPDGSDTLTATLTLSNPAAGSLTTGTFGSATATYNAGTGVWTVNGTLADVNAALAAVAFTPAANWDQDVTVTTQIRDAANAGPANGTITLDVTAQNDTPTDISLTAAVVTHSGGSNASVGTLSTTDVDAGQTHTYTLVSGTGDTNNALFNISGTTLRANDAAAMAPGPYSVRLQTDDGNGGLYAEDFTINVQDNVLPTVTSINRVGSASTNATSVGYTVTFSESVDEVDTGDFTLSGGGVTGTVASVSGSGSIYTVTVSGISGSGTLRLDLNNGATGILDESNNAIATGYTSGEVYTIDTQAPVVSSVLVPANATYITGQNLDFTVNFGEAVTVNTVGGTPSIALTLDTGGTVQASYLSGSGGSALVFRATVAAGWEDANGIGIGSALDLNGGTLRDAAGNDAVLNLNSVGTTTGVLVDAIAPAAPSALDMTAGSDSGTSSTDNITSDNTPTFQGTAEVGSTVTLYDTDGVTSRGSATANGSGKWSITSTGLAEGTHTLTTKATDVAGNVSAASSGLSVTIDTTAPTLAITSDVPTLKAGETATITFTFSEDPGASFTWDGSIGDVVVSAGTLGAIAGSGLTRTATFTPTADTNSGSATVTVAAGTYADAAGNSGAAGTPTPSITFDTLAPAAPSEPDMTKGSDSGSSATDNITSSTTPTFTGTAEVGSTVTLYDTDRITSRGSTVADGSGNWSITSAVALTEGTHTLTTKATDAAGNISVASSGLSLTIDTTVPTFASATVNGNTLVMTYTEAATLDAANLPAPGDFAVMVGVTANAVTGIAINASAKTVTLTLTTAVNAGQVVTVAYTDPTGVDDANALQDAAGNDAATLTATAVTNNTPVPDPGTPPATPVDGVPVVTTPGDGGTTIITIPVVQPTRPDDPGTPNAELADIPLVTAPDGRPIVQVSVPVGVGLQAQGLPNPVTGEAALAELGLRIERVAAGNPELTNNGQVFFASLDPSEPLTVQTITATAGEGFNPNVPFVISGSTVASDGKQAIILDARALPSGTLVQVDNVDFIAVVGAVRIIGGAGQNIASGDSSAQWIVLGEDDDVIHGGGGNDIVASKAGNDRLYGDDGNDTIVGGVGDDHLEGGAGNDLLQGGMSDTGAWSFALNTDGSLQVSYSAGQPLLTDTHNGSIAGRWSGGDVQDARIALVYQDYTQLETISLLFQGLTAELPTLQAMNTFATQGWSRAELLQAAWTWYEDTLPANASTREKVQALIGQTWGESQATEQNIQTGLDYLAQGGSWSEGLAYLVGHTNVRHLIADEGKLTLTQNATLSEAGWGADSGADTLLGGAGNDVLIGGSGNDILDGGQGTDMAAFVGAVQNFSLKLRASTASDAVTGQQEVVLRYNLSGEEDILRSVELVQIGGQAYRLELQGLEQEQGQEDAYQALAGYVQVMNAQELVLVGLPNF